MVCFFLFVIASHLYFLFFIILDFFTVPQPEEFVDDNEVGVSLLENSATNDTAYTARSGVKWQSYQLAAEGRRSSYNILRQAPGVKTHVRRRVSTPFDAWSEMIDKTIIDKTTHYSNISRPADTPTITRTELLQFVGLQYARGLYNKNIPLDYLWNKDFGIQLFPNTMPRSKFRHVSKILRFDQKSNRAARSNDRFTHIREIFERFVSNCSTKYVPEASLTVDEQLLPHKSRCKWITFMPNKPDKYGLKFWAMVEVENKYVISLSPYLGKDPSGMVAKNLATNVVMDLVDKAGLSSGYNITADNYFTSLQLIRRLKERNLSYVGTMRQDRVDVCSQMLRKKELHSNEAFYSSDALVLSYQCKPRKCVLIASSMHSSPGPLINSKPEVLHFYNKNKCGVDVMDQMTRLYTTKAASRRWPVAVWSNILDIAAINAWVIFKKCTGVEISRRDFIFQLVRELTCQTEVVRELTAVPHSSHQDSCQHKEVARKRKHCSQSNCTNTGNIVCSKCDRIACGKCLTVCDKFTFAVCSSCE